jgi:small-conductance mechanosensitive channel
VVIGVEYGVDMDRAKAALLEVARAHPEVLPDPPPSADLAAFGAHSLDLRLSYWVSDYLRMLPVAEMLRVACYRKLAEVGIAIPFPTRTLYLKGADGGDRPPALPA